MREGRIFQQAIEIVDSQQRAKFVAMACDGNRELQNRVERLIKAHCGLGDFLDESGFISTSETVGVAVAELDDGAIKTSSSEKVEPTGGYPVDLHFLQPSSTPGVLGTLGHYEVLDLIGQGAFGLVLRARDMKLERIVAIKVMHPNLATTSPPRKRFLREARAAAAIKHQNVVSVYSVEEHPIPYLVMEYIQGETLQDRINDIGPLDLDEILPIAIQISEGLGAAHNRGVIHRDIKPSNILVERGAVERIVLTDFGLARTIDDASLTQSGYVAGTPMYMSPEQALGQSLDARSDLFSLGSLLYQMLTGRPPFRAPSTIAVLRRVVESKPRPIAQIIPDAPSWLVSIIDRLHEKSPQQRIQTAAELSKLLQEGGHVPPRPIPLATPESTKGRTRWFARAGVASLLVVVMLLALLTYIVPSKLPFTNNDGIRVKESDSGSEGAKVAADDITPSQNSMTARPMNWSMLPDDAPSPVIAPLAGEQIAELQREWAAYLDVPVELINSLGIRFRLIPPGEFWMGSRPEEIANFIAQFPDEPQWQLVVASEGPRHRVQLTEPFYLAITEVTQDQFEQVMSVNPSRYASDGSHASDIEPFANTWNLPVEGVSWEEGVRFCRLLSTREGLEMAYEPIAGNWERLPTAMGYCFPSEAQWEYACRAGSDGLYSSGNDEAGLAQVAYFGNAHSSPQPVGQLAANAFGLYDMHGNVHEWVNDYFDVGHYFKLASQPYSLNPIGPVEKNNIRVAKGGDFYWPARDCRSAARSGYDQTEPTGLAIGLRLAMSIPTAKRVLQREDVGAELRDYVECHELKLDEFMSWAEMLPAGFRPTCIHLRDAGRGEYLVTSVAGLFDDTPECRVMLVEGDFESVFQEMRSTYRNQLRIKFPEFDNALERTLAVWIHDSRDNWLTYGLFRWKLIDWEAQVSELSRNGNMPDSLHYSRISELESYGEYTTRNAPGVGHKIHFRLTPQEYIELVGEYQRRGWRPHLMQFHLGAEGRLLSAVFRENSAGIVWDFSSGLTVGAYEQELIVRRSSGFAPRLVGAYQGADTVEFMVVWEKMKI
jgi:serine/threonine protein kinase/formylglycine-generating enzyme required for sulfatase activity